MANYVTACLFVVCSVIAVCFVFRRRRRKGEPPLVQHAIPFVGAALDFGRDPAGYLRQMQRRHGDVFTIKLAGWNQNVFMNALDVRNLEKSNLLDMTEILRDFVSRMVGDPHRIHSGPRKDKQTSEDDPHDNLITRLISTNLRGSVPLSQLCQSCGRVVPRALSHALEGKVARGNSTKFQLHELCKRLIFDVTYNLLFGTLESDERCKEDTESLYREFYAYHKDSALLVDRIPIHFLPHTKRARNNLFKRLGELDWSQRTDVSSLISDLVGVNPKLEFLHERTRHLLIMLWSAQANTIPALFWSLFYILANPDAKTAIREELDSVLRSSSSSYDIETNNNGGSCKKGEGISPNMQLIRSLDKTTIDKLVVLDSCVREVMRMTGSSMNLRRAIDDVTIKTASGKSYAIRKGDYTMYYAPQTHMDHEIFENPKEFIYDRFIARPGDDTTSCMSDCSETSEVERSTALRPKSRFYKQGQRISASQAILTFGYGKTRCPGRHIAMIEVKMLILSFITYFDFKIATDEQGNTPQAPDFDLRHVGFGVMPPQTDIDVTIAIK